MEKTKEENCLIAEFMGLEVCDGWNNEDGTPTAYWRNNLTAWQPPILVGDGILPIRMMKFHTSWDWLMPVVEKIWQLDIDTINLGADFTESNPKENIFRLPLMVPIDMVYRSVVEFIKWYQQTVTPKE